MLDDATVLRTLLEPVVESAGFELVMIELTGPGGLILRLYIDSPGGILLEDCETVSKLVSSVLDVEDPIGGEYTLEVSSPGLDRPLTRPKDFKRFVGSRTKLTTKEPTAGRHKFTGELLSATDSAIQIDVDGQSVEIAYGLIDRARLVPEF